MIGIIRKLTPPDRWKLPVLLAGGVIMGLFFFLFYISKAHSYLSDDPETCMNCHIMAPQYTTWNHSSHRETATCVDCHVPHNNIFNKYYFKAKDGLRHATIFTLRREPQVIFIREEGRKVVQNNCIRCHEYLITDDRLRRVTNSERSVTVRNVIRRRPMAGSTPCRVYLMPGFLFIRAPFHHGSRKL